MNVLRISNTTENKDKMSDEIPHIHFLLIFITITILCRVITFPANGFLKALLLSKCNKYSKLVHVNKTGSQRALQWRLELYVEFSLTFY